MPRAKAIKNEILEDGNKERAKEPANGAAVLTPIEEEPIRRSRKAAVKPAPPSRSRTPRKQPAKTQNTDGLYECVVLRDFWSDEGGRQRKGTILHLPVEELLDGIETGLLSRRKLKKG